MSKQSCKPSDEQLVLSARNGDTDALAQLIVRFLPDIQAKAGCYKLAGLEPEDLVQEGLIGLLRAVKSYDSIPQSFLCNLCFPLHPVSDAGDHPSFSGAKTSAAE